jgi:ABC-2 type transport system ATP-binding protein
MMKEIVLKVSNITKQFKDTVAVDQVSFELRAGEIIGLLGPNGAGKTTTINMILGILEPSEGTIEVFGQNLKKSRSAINQQTNFAAVYAHMPDNLTIWQNLYVFGKLYEVKKLKEKINALIKDFDLEKFTQTKAGLLSSGERSRLSLAKSVINEPSLLFLDEPTASLDPSVAEEIREKIMAYAKNNQAAVLWTSHNMKEIETVCDRVLFMSHGKILLEGNPRTLPAEYSKKDLEELFITVAREPLTLKE